MYFATAKEMETLDRLAVENGLEIRQMMELAGWHMLAVFRRLNITSDKTVVIVVGVGNKGGDGLCAARHLVNHGYQVSVVLLSEEISPDALHHLRLLRAMKAQIISFADTDAVDATMRQADVVIDALIGYHLQGAPRDEFARAVQVINDTSATIIAYDLPTGVDPDTGECLEPCVKADVTLTLALPKKLFEHANGHEIFGRVFLADIGIPSIVYDTIVPDSRPGFEAGSDGLLEVG